MTVNNAETWLISSIQFPPLRSHIHQAFYVPRSNPDSVAVTVHCLDPVVLKAEGITIEVRQYDGANWEQAFEETGIGSLSK